MIKEIFINLSYFDMIFPNMPGPVPGPFVGINTPEWLWLMTNNLYIFSFFGRISLQIFQILVRFSRFFFILCWNIFPFYQFHPTHIQMLFEFFKLMNDKSVWVRHLVEIIQNPIGNSCMQFRPFFGRTATLQIANNITVKFHK